MNSIQQPQPIVSIAICTYNRSASLARTLETLTEMRVPESVLWELLLIDNNSIDDTREVAGQFADKLPMRYLFERNQGLSHARNRALSECRGDAIIFTDDDILVDTGWLTAYVEGFGRHPDVAYCGGPIHLYWPDGQPGWVRDERMPLISGLLGYYNLGDSQKRYKDTDMHPFGANFALSRTLFENLDLFRTDLGVAGSTPGRGEEAEYFRRVRESGVHGLYLPDARCYHTIHKSHLELKYLYRYGVQKGIAANLMDKGKRTRGSSFLSQAAFALKGLLQLAKGRGDRARQCLINMGIERGSRD